MFRLLLAAFLFFPTGGCSCGGKMPVGPDATLPSGYSLELLNETGDSVGLPFSGEATLSVRYVDNDGEPVEGAEVRFSLVSTSPSEATGGATLSNDVAITDEAGAASVGLTAGVEEANFRVQVSAPYAPPVLYFVAVSAEGFVELRVVPRHQGWRQTGDFSSVELRLYMATDLRCSQLDIDAPPVSVLPPRSLSGFGETATFQNLGGQRAYTLVAWTLGGGDTRLSFACADLAENQLPTGPPVEVDITLRDRPLSFSGAVPVRSGFGVAALADALAQELPHDPWNPLACPLGPAQLLIDCALDAHSPDGDLDCQVSGPDDDGLLAAVAAERGDPDQGGCRPATAPGGGDSLDKVLYDSLDGSFPLPGAGLDDLRAARADTLVAFTLHSELSIAEGAASHRLLSAELSVGGAPRSVELFSSARPVVEQAQIPVTIEGAKLALAAHGFTLRYGSLAHAAFVAGGLEPAGLAGSDGALGTALAASAGDCAGLSDTLCTAVSRGSTCLQNCATAVAALDTNLELWWQLFDGSGLDFMLEGSAQLFDDDGDLTVDRIGSQQSPGSWTATVTPASGPDVELSGDLFTPDP